MSKLSEHERIERVLENVRLATLAEIAEQQAQSTYHSQWAVELDRIARRMDYSADQQVIFRISNDCQRLSKNNARSIVERRALGRAITRAIKRNAANRQGSAA